MGLLFVYILESYWLVMEYADGGALRDYLKDNFDTLTWNDKYNLAYQLARALLCLHDENIVHRDLVNITCYVKLINIYTMLTIIYLIDDSIQKMC